MPKGDGLTKPLKLSDDLAAIIGVEEASRAECIKLIWAYLKANELQVHNSLSEALLFAEHGEKHVVYKN